MASKTKNENVPSHYKSWKNDDKKLKRMMKDGSTADEIASALGRTKVSVLSRKCNLKIKARFAPSRTSMAPATIDKHASPTGKKIAVAKSSVSVDTAIIEEVARIAKKTGVKMTIIAVG